MDNWRCGSGTFRMNVALSELPNFTCLPSRRRPSITPPASSSRPASPTWSSAYMDARRSAGRGSPIVEMHIPAMLDESLAPRASTWPACSASMSRRNCPDGCSWDDHREAVADLMIDTVDALRAEFPALGAGAEDPLAARPRKEASA